jgi:DNA-binding SARP family transcriptional activator
MDSSPERDHIAQLSSREGGTPESQNVLNSNSSWSTAALYEQCRDGRADLPESASTAARRREDHLPLDSPTWKLGNDLIEQHEYARAAECFRRVLLAVGTSADQLSIEAVEVAVQLCAALSHERSIGEKLQDASRMLSRNLSQLGYEEISFVRDTLAACAQVRSPDAHRSSSTLTVREETETTVGRALLTTELPTPAYWDSLFNVSEVPAVSARSHLCIHFFGRFELLRNGEEVVYLGRNTRALAILKYLLAHRKSRPVPQDYLMGWLWPESDLKRARWSLNSAIYALRKLLGRCLPSLAASETILFEGGSYRLSSQVRLNADTDEFDSHYEEGHRLENAGRMPEAVTAYEKAVELYRGDYLSEDLYQEWTAIERERLLDAYKDSLRRLSVYYMHAGYLRESIRTCYRVLEKDSCDEATHCLLIECYIRLGQRGRALRQYRLCEGALRHEYDTKPSPETQALYTGILKDAGSR